MRWDIKNFGGGAVPRSMYMSYFFSQRISSEGQEPRYIAVFLRDYYGARVLTSCLLFNYVCYHDALNVTWII